MDEIEVKVLGIDKKKIIEKLVKLGAIKIYEGKVTSIIYDIKNVLRLRKFHNKVLLTYKIKKKEDPRYKIMDETEVEVSDFEITRDVLKKLGLKEKVASDKIRTSYRIDAVEFDIDTIEGIPTYMEIEGKPEKIEFYVQKLGLGRDKVKPWTTKELIEFYQKA